MTNKEYETIEKKVLLYNKRATEASKVAIVKLLAPEASKIAKQQEDTKAAAKGIKRQIKKTAKANKTRESDKEELDLIATLDAKMEAGDVTVSELQALINKYKKVEEKTPEAQSTPKPRGGENYRMN